MDGLHFFQLEKHALTRIYDIEQADVIILSFNSLELLEKELGWSSKIYLEIDMARRELKFEYNLDHYLISLQLKDNGNFNYKTPLIILGNKTQCILIYDEKRCSVGMITEQINTVFERIYNLNNCRAFIPYALIRANVSKDRVYLGEVEEQISEVEQILDEDLDKIQDEILALRRTLSQLKHHYLLLIDLLEEINLDHSDFFPKQSLRDYRFLSNKIERLYGNTVLLHEYISQVHDNYRVQMDINLNRTMELFTMISLIFLPPTLIVGWYGMNFNNMPELSSRYGYLYVIVLSLIVLVLSIFFIKRRGFWKR